MKDKLLSWAVISFGIVLAITGLAKVAASWGSSPALDVLDPLLTIKFKHLLVVVGAIEAIIGFSCLRSRARSSSALLVAWLATNLLVYRLGLWFIDWRRPCGCLGNLTDLLHISPQLADNTMKGMLAYLLVGSYASLFWLWKRQGTTVCWHHQRTLISCDREADLRCMETAANHAERTILRLA